MLETEGGETLARERALVLGREHGEGFVVASGLEAGDQLIVAPLDRLSDGALVVRREDAPGVRREDAPVVRREDAR